MYLLLFNYSVMYTFKIIQGVFTYMYEEYKDHCIEAYAAYLTDNKELLSCTSGGVATALSKKIIDNGGYVAGVRYSDDFHSIQYDITNTIEGLEKFKGSKYAEVDKGTIYKDVKQLLDNNKTVLFFGLPCVVMALKYFLKKDYPNLYTVELICHGPTDISVHRQYIEYLEKRYKSSIIDFNVRKKEGKWLPPYLYAKFANGKIFKKPFYNTEYGYAFSNMAKPACYHCKARGNNRTGDIMIGDFWGANKEDIFWNNNGISAVLVHTKKGSNLLKSTKNLSLYKTHFEKIVSCNKNIITPRPVSRKKDIFKSRFLETGLFKATNKTQTIYEKIIPYIKDFIPEFLKTLLKKICKR